MGIELVLHASSPLEIVPKAKPQFLDREGVDRWVELGYVKHIQTNTSAPHV